MKVPVNEPVITQEAKDLVNEALNTGWVSSAGPCIDKFEHEFAEFLGVKHATTVTSGTSALHLALLALGVGPGDEVIVPAFTMIASVYSIIYTGATPVFIDSEPDTYNMDVTQLESKITKRTKAIMPVHIYGHSCDMDPILEVAGRHGIPVLEDAAEAHGATYKSHACGSIGKINCFSFYANKIITTGEGGMVVTNDDHLMERCKLLKDLSHAKGRRFWHEELGYNYRMTNLQAALGLGQLHSIQKFLETKDWMAKAYGEGLKNIPGIRLPITKDYAKSVYWMYAVYVEPSFPLSRDELRAKFKERDIDTRDFFLSAPSMPVCEKFVRPDEKFPVAEDLGKRGFYLPSGLALTKEQLEYVCNVFQDIAKK